MTTGGAGSGVNKLLLRASSGRRFPGPGEDRWLPAHGLALSRPWLEALPSGGFDSLGGDPYGAAGHDGAHCAADVLRFSHAAKGMVGVTMARYAEVRENARSPAQSVRTSAGFRSGQWPSRSEHSVPMLGGGPDQRHLFGHPWLSMLSIALQRHGFIGRGPGSAQLAPPARQAPGRGRRSTESHG